MKTIGIEGDFKMLQIDFTKRVYDTILKPRGKKLICWDELTHPKLFQVFDPSELVLQRWRSNKHLSGRKNSSTKSTPIKHNVIGSFGYYLNRLYPAKYYYHTSPKAFESTDCAVLGGEACLWANLICSGNMWSTLLPNLCPVAEQLWSPQDIHSGTSDQCILDMYKRMDHFDNVLCVIETEIDHRNTTKGLPKITKCFESIWGGFTVGHPRNSLTRHVNVPLVNICDFVLPESKFARELYDSTVKLIAITKCGTKDNNQYIKELLQHYEDVLKLCDDSVNELGWTSLPIHKLSKVDILKNTKYVAKCAIDILNSLNTFGDSEKIELQLLYREKLNAVELIYIGYYQQMHIAICPAVKLLIQYKLNPQIKVPLIPNTINKTRLNGIYLNLK
jgi:hypothetical protein